MKKTKNKDGALEKNVDYQFEFPRQCIVQKNALSLTQAPMIQITKIKCLMHFVYRSFNHTVRYWN